MKYASCLLARIYIVKHSLYKNKTKKHTHTHTQKYTHNQIVKIYMVSSISWLFGRNKEIFKKSYLYPVLVFLWIDLVCFAFMVSSIII